MYLGTGFLSGIPWGQPGMRNCREAWLPERLGLIENLIYREETKAAPNRASETTTL
jgi:hypothetical protein